MNKEERIKKNIPTILVIFGATGDLMRRKLAPALFNLYQKGELPDRIKIVGFSRRNYAISDFRDHVLRNLRRNLGPKSVSAKKFLEILFYLKGNFSNSRDYRILAKNLLDIDRSWGLCSNKLFYLAVAPELYKTIFSHLAESGLTKPCSPEEGWTRVIVEKPFGRDLKTAQELDKTLGKLFREEQIYRIDHYLAKEMLQNILAFRFSNNLLEKNWNRETIEKIDVRLWEKKGAEDRGDFYDGVGALRDVGQNHLLQMLGLITMARPESFLSDNIRLKRAEVLRTLKVMNPEYIRQSSFRAQYRGYRKISGVARDSDTETYFAIKTGINSGRWRGVPVTLESGKRMGAQRKEIVVTFRHPLPCLCPASANQHYQNKIVFSLEPEEKIAIHFWSKKPGFGLQMEERTFEFLLRPQKQKSQYVEEYEKLLLDCVSGDQTLFLSTKEVEAMWRFIDPIVRSWQKGSVELKYYNPGTLSITEEANRVINPALEKQKQAREIGLIGLGKMGLNLALRLQSFGWRAVVFDSSSAARESARERNWEVHESLSSLVGALKKPRVLLTMIPAGAAIDEIIFGAGGLVSMLGRGDSIIDGGNSFFIDSIRRGEKLKKQGINFLDVGISGGPSGARNGASLMIGGERKIFEKMRPLFEALSMQDGFGYMGKSGAGHFVKMVHNGIEYGMMQSIAEGFSVLKRSPLKVDLKKIAEVFNRGSVIESRLIGWLASAFDEFGESLEKVSGKVGHTGEGEWTVKTAKKLKVPAPIIKAAFHFRVKSKNKLSYTGKVLTALRNQFGGHSIK